MLIATLFFSLKPIEPGAKTKFLWNCMHAERKLSQLYKCNFKCQIC